MKVTKLIREYIEEQVSNVYDAKVNPYTEQAKADKEMLTTFQNDLHCQQKKMLDEFMEKNKLFCDWGNHSPIESISTSVPGIYRYYTKAMLDEELWRKENNRCKHIKIKEIMVNLELGATRQELNEMIAKLLEEDND